jgi:hypothetical protein
MDHKIFDAATRRRFSPRNSSIQAGQLTQDKSAFTIEIDHLVSLLRTDRFNSLFNNKHNLFKKKHNGECSALTVAKRHNVVHHNDHHPGLIFFEHISHTRKSALTVARLTHLLHLLGVTAQKSFDHNKNSAFTVTAKLAHDTHPLEFDRNVCLTLRNASACTIKRHNNHLTNITSQKNTSHSLNKLMRNNRYKLRSAFPDTSKSRQCINTDHKRQMAFRRVDGTVLDSRIVRKGGGR